MRKRALVNLSDALAQGVPPVGSLAVAVFTRGSLTAEMYQPEGVDIQEPHDRDEIYVVARGSGSFYDGVERHAVQVGDFIFIAAGQAHRFEDFSADFATWVFFYGPVGGEGDA